MTKKEKRTKPAKSNKLRDFQNYKYSYETKLMRFDIREINTKYWYKYISKGIAIFFTICFGFIAILNYIYNIPIPSEIKIGIPISTGFISDIPSIIISLFRKSPT